LVLLPFVLSGEATREVYQRKARDRTRDAGSAVARHPNALTIHAAVQLATAAVLLHEGVEGGEEFGHRVLLNHLISPLQE
jgi:hypothetical protein